MLPVTKHEDIFEGLISYMNIDGYGVKGFDKAVTLSHCNDELGLLPNWMFRADMISVMLTKNRCYDVIYERNDDAISLLTHINPQSSLASLEVQESYNQYPCSVDMPKSLRALISSLAITDSMKIDREARQIEILPLIGFFKLPENGKALVFPSILAIEGHLFNQLGQTIKNVMTKVNEPNLGLVR